MTQAQRQSDSLLTTLPWGLIVGLGALVFVRPLLGFLGYSQMRAWSSILITLAIMTIWIGAVVVRQEPHPVATLTAAGGMYAIFTMLLKVTLQGNFSRFPAITVVGILVTNLIWGAVSGGIAEGLRRIRS